MWPDLELIGLYPSRFSGLYFTGKGLFHFSIRSMHNVSGYGILLDSGHGDAYTVCAMKLQVISSNVVIFTLAVAVPLFYFPPKAMTFSYHWTLCN